ncbi:MAG: type II secretion system F family protein [Actinobacteria bacterium]|nr:type II secretion system F family protein [Actinomycetota bacterium]
MPFFDYRVKNKDGKLLTGTIESDALQSVITRLRQSGYLIIKVTEKAESGIYAGKIFKKVRKVSLKDLTIFSRQFATMITSGLPLIRCLNILHQQTKNKNFKNVISQVQHDVESGQTLSNALAKYPKIFPDLYVNMVKAGEAGGVLDEVLMRLAEHLEKEGALRHKIKSAMTYPVLMFVFSIVIVFVMITFIVPVFVKMFADIGGDLPLPTKIIISASNFVQNDWYLLLAFIFGGIYGLKKLIKTKSGRIAYDSLRLKLPLIGPLARKVAVAQFTRTFGTLITSGVPILGALEIVGNTSGNVIISSAVDKIRTSIKEGETIAKPLEKSGVFPPMVIQMIAVGEETGALDSMLQKIADFYDEEVGSSVEALTSLIEPLMIIFMGLIVGGILISLYLPMFSLITSIK